MNNKVLLIVGGGCVIVLLCVVCIVGALFLAPGVVQNQFGDIISKLGGPNAANGSVPIPNPPATGGPAGLPKPTSAPNQPSSGNLFADAANKAKGAQKYRVEFSMLFGSTQNGKYSEEPFIDLSGEVDGQNSHFTSKGGIFALLAGGGGTLEIIEADGKTYMKGISLMGMTDPKVWYIQKDSSSSGFQDFAKPDFYSGFTGSSKPGDFSKVRSESLDGQSCDVYNYNLKSVQNSAITGLLGSSKDKSDFSAIDKAEINVWLCGDGFVHKYTLDYQGHNQSNANEKGAMKINSHLWDFNNGSIKVTAPAGAKPMPGQ